VRCKRELDGCSCERHQDTNSHEPVPRTIDVRHALRHWPSPEAYPSSACDHRHLPDDEEDETSEDDPEGLRVGDTSVRDVQDRGEEAQGNKNGDADLAEETEFVLPHWTLRPRAFRLTTWRFSGGA